MNKLGPKVPPNLHKRIWAIIQYGYPFSLSYQNTLSLQIIQWLLEIMLCKVWINLNIISRESVNILSKMLKNKKLWTLLIVLFIPLLFKKKLSSVEIQDKRNGKAYQFIKKCLKNMIFSLKIVKKISISIFNF
jgi:hypothetical protein